MYMYIYIYMCVCAGRVLGVRCAQKDGGGIQKKVHARTICTYFFDTHAYTQTHIYVSCV